MAESSLPKRDEGQAARGGAVLRDASCCGKTRAEVTSSQQAGRPQPQAKPVARRWPAPLLRPLPPWAAGEAVWEARNRGPRLLRPLPPKAAGEAVWGARRWSTAPCLRPLPPKAAGVE